MTPDELKLLQDTARELDRFIKKMDQFLDLYRRMIFIDKQLFMNKTYFKGDVYLPAKIAFFGGGTPKSQQAAITPPSGGATVDSQARTAIADIITKLQTLGLTL